MNESSDGQKMSVSIRLYFTCTNNQVEYEAIIISLEILLEMKARNINVYGDSQLVLKQVNGIYGCHSLALASYFIVMVQLLDEFDQVLLNHVPRENNKKANHLAQVASSLKLSKGLGE